LEFKILGPLEVADDGRRLELGAAKQQALLGVLLLRANQLVSTDSLVDELWGETPPVSAAKLVQAYVSGLRKVLGAEAIVTRPGGYLVRTDPERLDAACFERLAAEGRAAANPEQAAERFRDALAIWRGRPLQGLGLEASARNELERLDEQRLMVLEERVDAELVLGRHAELIGELRPLVAEHPYRERLRGQLMLALYRAGRQAEALQVYREGSRLLDEQLGLEPSQELRELERRILIQDEGLALGERAAALPETLVRSFLIADVRGYTRFTHEHGDAAGAEVAAEFARLARETVASGGGEVVELRGDEALCAFTSARRAVQAAVALQRTFRRRDDGRPAFPLPIGIGLDAGEALPVEGGFRGGALNTAARLCGLAAAGEILATDTLASLARRIEGIRFVPRKPLPLKGFARPVRIVEVVPEAELPPVPALPVTPTPRRVSPGGLAAAATAAILLLGALVALGIGRWTGRDALERIDANALGIVDPETGGIDAQVALASRPSAIAAGGGYIWVASETDGTLSRIDTRTRAVQTLEIGESAAGVAYGGGSVWVTNSESRSVTQVNPDSLTVVQTIPVGNSPGAVAAGDDAVWVANRLDGTVSRIDLERGAATKTIPVGPAPSGLAAGADAVWAASEGSGRVLRLDPRTGAVVEAINVGNGPTGITVGEGAVWVTNRQDGTVSRIDPATNANSATVRVGDDPVAIAAARGAVWTANAGDGTLARIDPQTRRVEKTVTVGSSPNGLAMSHGNAWLTALPSTSSHRGGVLRVASFVQAIGSPCRCPDPALAFFPQFGTGAFASLAYDGLLAYRRTGGRAGSTLVPNLAVRVPAPANGGKTYTFQVRRGIRFSNGVPLRASDVGYSLDRLLAVQAGTGIYTQIGGASEATLSPRVESDDRTRTVTIHLNEPDPDYLYKLALPYASIVPDGTPLTVTADRPPPGTGPYRIASFDYRREVRLVRNPHFRVWSHDARPDGYPDEIRFRVLDDAKARLRAVERGRADWATGLPSESLQRLLTRHAGRLHSAPINVTKDWMVVNRVPPFDDRRVRQALSYAVDRAKIAQLSGGELSWSPTCQILAPGWPGHEPYCPYTLNPSPAGTWSAPDLTLARGLVAASGTRGMSVEVVGWRGGPELEAARYFADLLRQLGYRSTLTVLRDFEASRTYDWSLRRAQIVRSTLNQPSATPSVFFELFSCTTFGGLYALPEVFSIEFCDPGIDAQMRRAAAAQRSDPVRATALWKEVDRALVDHVPVVPLTNRRQVVFVSERVGNFQYHPQLGTLFDQLWVR
jgi:YVTN family beta-propeller protein